MSEAETFINSDESDAKQRGTSIRRAAMDFLARREHSRYELQQKLESKFPDAGSREISARLERLQAENLQSDQRFTEAWVRYRKSRGFGYYHIRKALLERRIHTDTIDEYLQEGTDDWVAIARTLIRKRSKDPASLIPGSRDYNRLLRFLMSRGFSQTSINQALESYNNNANQASDRSF